VLLCFKRNDLQCIESHCYILCWICIFKKWVKNDRYIFSSPFDDEFLHLQGKKKEYELPKKICQFAPCFYTYTLILSSCHKPFMWQKGASICYFFMVLFIKILMDRVYPKLKIHALLLLNGKKLHMHYWIVQCMIF